MTFFCLSNIVSKSDGLNPSKYKSSFVSSIYFQSFFLVCFDFVKRQGRCELKARVYIYIYCFKRTTVNIQQKVLDENRPPVLDATTIARKGNFGVISYLLCLYLYSGMLIAFI